MELKFGETHPPVKKTKSYTSTHVITKTWECIFLVVIEESIADAKGNTRGEAVLRIMHYAAVELRFKIPLY